MANVDTPNDALTTINNCARIGLHRSSEHTVRKICLFESNVLEIEGFNA
jgi:hypothetical protein